MSTQNLIEQLGYDQAKRIVDNAKDDATHWAKEGYFMSKWGVLYLATGINDRWDSVKRPWDDDWFDSDFINLSDLRSELQVYEAMLAHDGNNVKDKPVPIDQLTFDALDKILERTPDPTADFYVADTDTYFSLETGTYFSHEQQAWLDSDYRTEQELRENYESVFNLLDVVKQVDALEPQAQTHTSSREAFERSQATEIKMDYSELKHRLDEHERILGYRYGEKGQLFNQWTSWDKAWQHQQKRIDALKKQMVRAGFTDNGGYLLKPPIGKAPNFELLDAKQRQIDAVQVLATEWAAADADNDKARTLKGCAKRIKKALGADNDQ
jgi:hypothetical protein